MLSDTLFDAKQDIIGGLLTYEPEEYGIPGTQIEEIANGLYHLIKVQAYRDGDMPDHNIFDAGTSLCSLEDAIISNLWFTVASSLNDMLKENITIRKKDSAYPRYNTYAFKIVFKVLNQRFPIERIFIKPSRENEEFKQTISAIKTIMA